MEKEAGQIDFRRIGQSHIDIYNKANYTCTGIVISNTNAKAKALGNCLHFAKQYSRELDKPEDYYFKNQIVTIFTNSHVHTQTKRKAAF